MPSYWVCARCWALPLTHIITWIVPTITWEEWSMFVFISQLYLHFTYARNATPRQKAIAQSGAGCAFYGPCLDLLCLIQKPVLFTFALYIAANTVDIEGYGQNSEPKSRDNRPTQGFDSFLPCTQPSPRPSACWEPLSWCQFWAEQLPETTHPMQLLCIEVRIMTII